MRKNTADNFIIKKVQVIYYNNCWSKIINIRKIDNFKFLIL